MSFGINPPNKNLSNIQASAKTCSGGGGNTGYFRRDGGGEEEDLNLRFASDYPQDSFEKQGNDEEQESFLDIILNFFSNIIEAVKKFFGISDENTSTQENNDEKIEKLG